MSGVAPPDTATALLERADELARIDERLAAARAGAGSLLLVEGQAGIGKTRLLAAARAAAHDASMSVLVARGSELERELAFGVVRQLLEPALARAGDARAELLAGAAQLAAPRFEPAAGGSVGGDRSFAMLHGLHWLCANLAARGPLLLTVDDAHWADAASLRFLVYLLPRLDELPAAIVAATRPPSGDAASGLAAALVADPLTEVVRPTPLSVAAVGALVAAGLNAEPEPPFVAACREVTGGVPFLVRELVRALGDEGIAPVAGAGERVRELGPRTIARTILGRLTRLPVGAGSLARALAVLGPDASIRHAAALAELDADDAERTADALAAAGILADRRPLSFAHPIVATAVHAEMLAGERARLHARAAALLARDGAGADRVASHLLAAPAAGDPATVETLRAAARGALLTGAPDSAAAYLRRALAEPPPTRMRSRVLLELGFAESNLGDPAATRHLEQALDAAADDAALLSAALAAGRMLQLAGRQGRAVEVADRALRRLTGHDPATELMIEAQALTAAQMEGGRAVDVAGRLRRLRERAEALADAPASVFGCLAADAAFTNEGADVAVRLARRALPPGFQLLPEPPDRPVFFYHATTPLIWAERVDEVRALYDRALADARRLGSAPHVMALSAFRGLLALRVGEVADAEADVRTALEPRPGPPPTIIRALALAVLALAVLERAGPDVADAALAVDGLDPGAGQSLFFGVLLHARGRLRLAQARPEQACDDCLAAGRLLERLRAPNPRSRPGAATPRSPARPLDAPRRRGAWRPRSSSTRARGAPPARSAPRCASPDCSLRGPTAWRSCARRCRRSSARHCGSSWPGRSSTSAPACAATARAQPPASRCGAGSTSPTAAARRRSPGALAPSSWPPARARGGLRSPASSRSRPASGEWRRWPRPG